MSAFEHEGIEYDVPDQPQVTGWEFKAYRRVRYEEDYYDGHSVTSWPFTEDSGHCYWIATRVEPEVKRAILGG